MAVSWYKIASDLRCRIGESLAQIAYLVRIRRREIQLLEKLTRDGHRSCVAVSLIAHRHTPAVGHTGYLLHGFEMRGLSS
jgi:hypothetical protein